MKPGFKIACQVISCNPQWLQNKALFGLLLLHLEHIVDSEGFGESLD
jgi:hypothetical protein